MSRERTPQQPKSDSILRRLTPLLMLGMEGFTKPPTQCSEPRKFVKHGASKAVRRKRKMQKEARRTTRRHLK